jgi:hypothetical protein
MSKTPVLVALSLVPAATVPMGNRDNMAGSRKQARRRNPGLAVKSERQCRRYRACETPVVQAVKSKRDTGAGGTEPGAGESAVTVTMGERDTSAGGNERARHY